MQKTTYTISVNHEGCNAQFELSNHSAALGYIIDNLHADMEISVLKRSAKGTEQFNVGSQDLPKYVQAKVKYLVPFAEHIELVQLAMLETECCSIYISQKWQFGWRDLNNEYEFNNAVCAVITSYCKEYGHKNVKFEVIPAYSDEQLDSHIANRTLHPICWATEQSPWHWDEVREQEEAFQESIRAELAQRKQEQTAEALETVEEAEAAAETPVEAVETPEEAEQARREQRKLDREAKIESNIEESVGSNSQVERIKPTFGPDQYDEYCEYERQRSERSGRAFNISGYEWDSLLDDYQYHVEENRMAWSFSGWLVHETSIDTQIMTQYNLTADEWIDIKEQFEWFCADFGYNNKNKELFLNYVQHWVSVNHSNNA